MRFLICKHAPKACWIRTKQEANGAKIRRLGLRGLVGSAITLGCTSAMIKPSLEFVALTSCLLSSQNAAWESLVTKRLS